MHERLSILGLSCTTKTWHLDVYDTRMRPKGSMMEFDKLQDLIDFAIWKEQKSADFYRDLAQRVGSHAVAAELLKITAMEERHRDWIKDNALSLLGENERTASGFSSLKAPKNADAAMSIADMTYSDALNVAVRNEAASEELYRLLAGAVSDPTAKIILENLATEEYSHKRYFEKLRDLVSLG